MKNDLLKYKGYFGSVQYSQEDSCLYGKVEFIDDLILYDGESVKEVKAAFQEAVDDYLASCAASESQPNITCKGSFNVRVGESLHRALAVEAMRNQLSLNEFVKTTLYERIHSLPSIKGLTRIVGQLSSTASLFQLHQQETQWLLEKPDDNPTEFILTREEQVKDEVLWSHH